MDEKQVIQFLNFLGNFKEYELRLIRPSWDKTDSTNEQKSWFLEYHKDVLDIIKEYEGKRNIYIGLNERGPGKKNDEDVLLIENIGHDIDAHEGNTDSLAKAQEVAFKIKDGAIEQGYKEPLIMCSGRGFWVIHNTTGLENTKENIKKIKQFGKSIKDKYEIDGIELDSTVYNPSRIVRVPGTRNVSDKENMVESFIVNDTFQRQDIILKEKISNIKIDSPSANIITSSPEKGINAFMDFCLTHEIPKGERHKVISRNMAIYLYDHPNRNLLVEQYSKIQQGSENELNGWLKNIDEKGKDSFPYSVGELVNFTKKYKIPFDWKITKEYQQWKKELAAQKKLDEVNAIEKNVNLDEVKTKVMTCIALKDEDKAGEEIVKVILKDNHIYTTRDDIKSEIWFYDDGIYVPNGKSRIKEISREIFGDTYTPQRVNKVIAKIEADTQIDHDEFFKDYSIDEIPVQNGILNVLTKDLSEFTPEKIFFTKLSITYDSEQGCPSIKKFFSDVLRDSSDVEVMIELIGFCLLKDYRYEKSAMFIGNGRNGKGKTLSLMKYFLGPENCSSIPLSQIIPTSTSVCELYGRLANLAGDLSNTDLKDTGMFKQVTGQDLITAKRKYLRDLFFTNYAKIIFACNELPRVYDLSDGFWSRWILFEFPYKFVRKQEYDNLKEEDKKLHKVLDESIIDKITTPEELSGLLNEALDGLKRLIDNKGFSYSKGTEEVKDLWIRKSDSFTSFCIDSVEEDYNYAISKKDLRKSYYRYCKKHNLPGSSDKGIKITLENRFGAYESQPMGGDRVWEGIKFKGNLK